MSRVALVAATLLTCAGLSQAATDAGAKEANATGTAAKAKAVRQEAWAPHRGRVVSTKDHRFETVYSMKGLEVYAYNLDHSPVALTSGVTGTARITLHDGTTKEVPLTLATDIPTGGQSRLVGTTDVLESLQSSAMVKISIQGLEGPEKTAVFHETYRPSRMHRENRAQSSNPSSGASQGSSPQSEQH